MCYSFVGEGAGGDGNGKGRAAIPANNDCHTLDSVPKKQSIIIITTGP